MKLRIFGLIALLLVACSGSIGNSFSNYEKHNLDQVVQNGEKYINVYYEFIRGEQYYKVTVIKDDKTNEYKVEPKYVYNVFVYENIFVGTDRLDNEFYVNGKEYALFVYLKR